MHMRINNPHELVGKTVLDANGNTVGTIDKIWDSWNQESPGWFYGVKPNVYARENYFRGSYKLIPIYSDYIKEVQPQIKLNKTTEELGRYWNMAVQCGQNKYPTDELMERPVYDRYNSRIGTIYCWVGHEGSQMTYGVCLDPYLCDQWKVPYNKLLPLDANYFSGVKNETIYLDKALHELREYWKQYQQY